MKIANLFEVPVMESHLNIDNKNLINKCYQIQDSQPKSSKSNYGGYQSSNLNLQDTDFNFLLNEILRHCDIINKKRTFFNHNFEISNYWININKHKDYNIEHTHPFSIFSGSFYIKMPKNCGGIEFLHPSELFSHHWSDENKSTFNSTVSSVWTYTPPEGTLLIFPSWLKHRVQPNESVEDRITLAFNITIKK
jgi:uncharacterized protein (TIGR02466 family)